MNVVASPMFDLIKQTWAALKHQLYVVFQRGDLFALPVQLLFIGKILVRHDGNPSTPETRWPYAKWRIDCRTSLEPEIAAGFPEGHDSGHPQKTSVPGASQRTHSPEFVPGDAGPMIAAAEHKEAASACYRGDPRINSDYDNRRVPRPAICFIGSIPRVFSKILVGW
jgi:hypothetical protein